MLRNYQSDILKRISEAFRHHRSVMVQMPTGTGKTVVLAEVVHSFIEVKGVILIVAHRRELIEQIKETIRRLGIDDGRIVVESIQTISRRIDALDFIPSLVVIDEAHHALAKTYRMMWKKWREARFLGLTATPCRLNGKGFTDLFDTLVMSWSIGQFIREGWLSLFDYYSIKEDSEEQRIINSLEKRGADGDYQVKELNAVLNKRPSIERLYESVVRYADGKKGIVYAINIDHAHNIAEYYREHGVNAVAIDSKTPAEERKQTVENFKAGKIRVMVSVDLFSEGFDCPDVEFIQLARPTLSLAKYLQMVGRGLRKSDGKDTCVMIDNVGLYRMFGLPAADRDWQAMFEGLMAGKGSRTRNSAVLSYAVNDNTEVRASMDIDLDEVISHEILLEQLKSSNIHSDRDGKGSDIIITGNGNKKRYLDQRNGMKYKSRPVSVWFGKVEMLKVEDKYFSRIKHPYKSGFPNKRNNILDREFYVDIFMSDDDRWRAILKRLGKPNVFHAACILANDDVDWYIIYSRLNDGSIIILNQNKDYYYVENGKEKCYIGSEKNDEETQKLSLVIKLLSEKARKKAERMETDKLRKKLLLLRNVVPFCSNNKWGLKLDGRVIVPPIYRSIKEPVGNYCAVEQSPQRWGIIQLDGKVVVDTCYQYVDIMKNGTANLTIMTGKAIKVKLEH